MRRTTGGLFKRGNIYWARWQHDGKISQQTTGETTEKKAAAWLAERMEPYKLQNSAEVYRALAVRAEDRQGSADALLKPALNFSDAWRAFLASETRRRPRSNTLHQYEIQWGLFVDWIKGAYPEVVKAEAVNGEIAAAFIRHLSAIRTANTANKYRGLLAMVWNRLKADKHLTAENPWEKIARREQQDEGRRELTIVELRRVCRKAKGELRALMAIGIYTGLRLGDAATLRWGEVDLVRGIIRRVPSKSRKGRLLTIPIHPALRAVLMEIPDEKHGDYVMPEIARDYARQIPLVTGRVQALFKSCKIKTLRDRKGPGARRVIDAGYHSLRHAFVSMCAESRVPLSVVQGLIGHTTAGMTEKYFHLSAGAAAAAIDSLPALTGGKKSMLALPPGQMIAAAPVQALARKLNAKNWKTVRDKLLAIVVKKAPAGTAKDEDKARTVTQAAAL